jgi:signal transduction histidine kinase
MLRSANWAVRVAVLAAVWAYVFAFLHGYPVVKIVAVAAATVSMSIWAVADRSEDARKRYAPVLSWALGATALMGAVASITPGGGPVLVLSFIAALGVGRYAGAAVGWVVAVVPVAAVVAIELAYGSFHWGETASAAAVLVGAMLIGQNTRAYRIQAEQSARLLAQAEQLRAEEARAATLDERSRIAREVHDVLAHSLGALGLQIQVVQAVLTDSDDVPRAVELLDQARRMAADGLRETRRAVRALRGDIPSLPDGLAELSATHRRQHGSPVRFEIKGEPRAISADAGLAITRAAQEALVNTAKHAPHQPVDVRLDYTGDRIRLMVTNHIAGKDDDDHEPRLVTVNGGYGLAGMRERLLLLDGALSAGRQGSDWVVEAMVPQ